MAKAAVEMIGAHIVIAGHDDDSVAAPAHEALRESGQKLERFLILLT